MSGMFLIWFFLLAAAISFSFALLSPCLKMRIRSILIAAICLGLCAGILYLTQWSQPAVALY